MYCPNFNDVILKDSPADRLFKTQSCFFQNQYFLVANMIVQHQNLSCETLKCSSYQFGNVFKTGNLSVNQRKVLQRKYWFL